MACQHNTDSLNMPTLQGIEGVMHLKTVERGSLSDFKGSDKGAHLAFLVHVCSCTLYIDARAYPLDVWQVDVGSLCGGCSAPCLVLTSVLQTSGKYVKGERPWGVDAKYDIALPCATQNEVGLSTCNT
jgi:hypothetical protein